MSARKRRIVAGVSLEGEIARVSLVESDDGTRRVLALEREALPPRATERGVVRDPDAVGRAVRVALARGEERADRRADLVVVATCADDLRVHRHVWRAVRPADAAVTDAEVRRAGERARRTATQEAVAAVSDEPALRRVALVPLRAETASVSLDGKPLVAPGRQRGEVLEVAVLVPVLPLAQSSGIEAAIAPLGRDARYVAGAVALGTLAAECGIDDAVVVWFGREITGVSVLHDGAAVGARSFSIGAGSFDARPADARSGDALVWARCVALAATDAIGDRLLPARTVVCGSEEDVAAVLEPLATVLALRQPAGGGTVSALAPAVLARLTADVPLDPTDLGAVAAGCA
jgi:hypothetical protein